jgi:hypothetical protein
LANDRGVLTLQRSEQIEHNPQQPEDAENNSDYQRDMYEAAERFEKKSRYYPDDQQRDGDE